MGSTLFLIPQPSRSAATLHDSMYLAMLWWEHCFENGLDHRNGTELFKFTHKLSYNGKVLFFNYSSSPNNKKSSLP